MDQQTVAKLKEKIEEVIAEVVLKCVCIVHRMLRIVEMQECSP
jgi:hypothetical protein